MGSGSSVPQNEATHASDEKEIARRRKELGLDDDDDDGEAVRLPAEPAAATRAPAPMHEDHLPGRRPGQHRPPASSLQTSMTLTASRSGGSDGLNTSSAAGSSRAAGISPSSSAPAPPPPPTHPSASSWSPRTSFQRRRIKLLAGSVAPGRWRKAQLIGKGATGAVYEAVEETSGSYFAVKEVEFAEDFADNSEDRRRFEALRSEVALLQELDDANIVKFLGIDRVGFNMYIMMEFVAGGSIGSLTRRFKSLPEDLTARYTAQIAHGLAYLHGKNIIHRDIKGANVLVSDTGVVKLADFGAAKRIIDPEQLQHTLAGTPYWMAPEVVRQQGHGKPADVWSLGATALQMLTGRAPYQELAPVPALFKIGHGTDVPVPATAVMSPVARDFITKCLTRDAALRPTVEDLLHHPWLNTGADEQTSPLMRAPENSVATNSPPNSPLAATGGTTVQEGDVVEYLIALSFMHDDDAADAALDQRTTSSGVAPIPTSDDGEATLKPSDGSRDKNTVGAVTFDAALEVPLDEEDDDAVIDAEFNEEEFEAFAAAGGQPASSS